jgi:hypothetical protein
MPSSFAGDSGSSGDGGSTLTTPLVSPMLVVEPDYLPDL